MAEVEVLNDDALPVLDTGPNPVRELTPAPAPAAPLNLFGADSPAEVVEKATEIAGVLKDVLVQRGHIMRIGQGQHVKVEGWTTLGAMLGVTAVTVHTEELADSNGYLARAEARTIDGRVVGAADAVCTRDERNWKSRDDYALLSMAQTRAAAKALRVPLGFVIELAGYSPTPAEEMASAQDSAPVAERQTGTDGSGDSASPDGDPPLPPLSMSEEDRLEDGSFPLRCPYCEGAVTEETRTIKRGTEDEREQVFTNCVNNQCRGGQPRKGRDAGTRWPWSVFGSLEGTFEAGGRIDALVNGDHGVVVENITPPFDPKAHLHRVLEQASEWDDAEKKQRITDAKREVAHGKRWDQATTQKVALKVMEWYWEEHPDDSGRPF